MLKVSLAAAWQRRSCFLRRVVDETVNNFRTNSHDVCQYEHILSQNSDCHNVLEIDFDPRTSPQQIHLPSTLLINFLEAEPEDSTPVIQELTIGKKILREFHPPHFVTNYLPHIHLINNFLVAETEVLAPLIQTSGRGHSPESLHPPTILRRWLPTIHCIN
jgi:hypothetical protein